MIRKNLSNRMLKVLSVCVVALLTIGGTLTAIAAAPAGTMTATPMVIKGTETKTINPITITDSGGEINGSLDIALYIPAASFPNTDWSNDFSGVSYDVSGNATGTMSSTATIALHPTDSNMVILQVTNAFTSGDRVVISGLKIVTTGESDVAATPLQWGVDGPPVPTWRNATTGGTLEVDATVPLLGTWDLDMDAGTVDLNFNDQMDTGVNPAETTFTIQDDAAGTNSYTLTDSTGSWTAPGTFTVTLSSTDIGALKGNTNIATAAGNSFIEIAAGHGFTDDAGNALANITTGVAVNTYTGDTSAPTVLNVYSVDTDNDGDVDALDVQFSEQILDSSVTLSEIEFDNDTTNDGAGEEVATGGSTNVTFPSAISVANDEYYRFTVPTGISGTDIANLHITGTSLTDLSSNAIVAADNVGTDVDRADPIIITSTLEYTDTGSDGSVETITMGFSEVVNWNGSEPNQFGITDNGLTGFDANNEPDSFTGNGTNTFTFTTSGTTDLTGVGAGIEPQIDHVTPAGTPATNNVFDTAGNALVNIAPTSISDGAAPVFASVDPLTGDYVNDTDVSYSLSENLAGGQITWSWESGSADVGAPHGQTLTGGELTAGTHTDITLTNNPTLVNGAVYTISFDGGDGSQPAAQVNSTGVTYDTSAPNVVSIVLNDTSVIIGDTPTVTITFDEPVTGFDNTDITTIDNGTLTPVSTADGGTTWTATFTPTGGVEDATNVITVTETGIADLAGNAGSGTTSSANYAVDTLAPTLTPVTIITTDADFDANMAMVGNTVKLSFTSSEALASTPAVADVQLDGNNADAVTNPSGNDYEATRVIQAGDTEGVLAFSIDFTDAAGNAGTTVTSITAGGNVTIDTTAPSIVSVTPSTTMINKALVGADAFYIDIDYDDSMGDHETPTLTFTPNIVTSGTLTLSGTSAWTNTTNGIYRFYYNVADVNEEVTITGIAINGGEDHAGNPQNAYSGGGESIVVDTTAPAAPAAPDMQAASDSGTSNSDDLTNDTTPTFDVVASDGASTMTLVSDVDGTIGTRTGSGAITSAVLTEGAHGITVVETDSGGNTSPASTALGITIDTTAPTLAETTPVTDPTNDQTPDVSFSSDEIGAMGWTGGCQSTTTTATAATQPITLDSDGAGGLLAEATYNCTLTVTDAAGNPSTGLALTAFTVDITSPTGTTTVGTATLYEGDLIQEILVTYDEPMDPVSTPTINFAGTTGAFTSNTDGVWATALTWTETFTIADANEEVVGATVNSSGATDFAGNIEGVPVGDTFDVDTLAPTLTTVTIASDNATDTTTAGIGNIVTLTITGSETINQPVVNYTSGAAAVADTPSTYGGAWTAAYTANIADTEGVVAYTIDFSDTIGNNGTQVTATTDASSVSYDNSAPVVTTYVAADDATGVAIGNNLDLTFDENVVVGTGNVVIYKASDDSVFEAVDITTANATFDGTTGVSINPTANMAYSTAYYVQVDATAVENTVGLAYAGIADKTTWNFTTAAAPPAPSGGGGSAGGRVSTPTPTEEEEEEAADPDAYDAPLVFSDVLEHWAVDYIYEAKDAGYVEGYADETFKPDQYITRSEAAKLIAMWLDANIGDDACNADLFSDIDCSEWYAKYVTHLANAGIIEGYADGTFGPGMKINRAEALKMMLFAKALQDSDITDIVNPFSDISMDQWFYNNVMIGYNLSIIQGYEDGTFGPARNITRAEFTKIFIETLINN